ncbi:MAG TPA: hypothetical protein VFN68_04660 [Acidimicrobiales bacterium]|nr:hypothetical protein [Acidimicrobiales bacterium]
MLPIRLVLAASSGTAVTLHPDAHQIPGSNVLQNLTNGLGWWALVAAMAGVVIGAVMWAFGHYSQNYSWQALHLR